MAELPTPAASWMAGANNGPTVPPFQPQDTSNPPQMEGSPAVAGLSGGGIGAPAAPEAPHVGVAQHILAALGGSSGEPMSWAKSILAGGLAAAANVGKVPEGAGWLAGASRGAQGLQQQKQLQLENQQKQQEMQLKQKQDARAEKELQNTTLATNAQVAMSNANLLKIVHEDQRAQSLAPYAEDEKRLNLSNIQDARSKSAVELKATLIRAGVKPEDLEDSHTDYSQATPSHAKAIASGDTLLLHNGEIAKEGEDGVGLHAVPGGKELFEKRLPEDTKVISGYDFDKNGNPTPKTTTMSAGHPVSDVYALYLAAQEDLSAKQKQITDQANVNKNNQEATKAHEEAFKAHEEGEADKALLGGTSAGGGAAPQNIDPKTGADEGYLKGLPPNLGAEVRAIGEGRVEINARMFQSKQGQQLGAALTRAYPGFDQSKAQSYFKMRQDFTSGKTGTAINSYNTGIAHLGTMYDHLAAANSVDINNPWSTVHRQLDLDKQLVSTELAKAVSNGQMTEGEQKSIMSSISGATVGSYRDRIREAVTLLHGKQEAYQEQWNNGAPPGAVSQVHIISPQAEQTVAKISGHAQQAPPMPQGATMKVPGSDGKMHWSDGKQDMGVVQ